MEILEYILLEHSPTGVVKQKECLAGRSHHDREQGRYTTGADAASLANTSLGPPI
jgi:hypothetical protein